jgi:Mor family transcriptional regulator
MSRRGQAAKEGSEMLAHLEAVVEASVLSTLKASLGIAPPKGMLENIAGRAGREAAEAVRIGYGGGQIYIPLDRVRRDAALYAAFTGDNHFELARRFRMSLNSVYKILRREKARRTARQLPLMDHLTIRSTQ